MHNPGWFDDVRIERTVTRSFVCSFLTPEGIAGLDKPAFGDDGLTNDTKWQWLESKARRLFLILCELGLPDQILRIIDAGWEDDDLPVPRDEIHRLALTGERDSKLEARWHNEQFRFLLRTLETGQHLDYDYNEVVPLDIVEKRPAGLHQDTIELPNHPNKTFSRRGVQLGQHMSKAEFISEISQIRDLQHDHVESYFASYTHKDHGYVLFTPASDYKLASYLSNNTPTSLKAVEKFAQRRLVLEWINCLVSTVSFIHSRGEVLGSIKPSTILATHDHQVLLPDSTYFNPDTHNSKSFSKESYDYSAPEYWRPSTQTPSVRAKKWTLSSASDTKPLSSFAISRGAPHPPSESSHNEPYPYHRREPQAQAPTQPQPLDPQAADIFSLGCILLDLLSHGLLKRSTSAFAAVRSAKHKNPGRGGAVLDASFHRNLGQVEVWMSGLGKDAEKKCRSNSNESDKGRIYAAVTPLLRVVERMLAQQPSERPSAAHVQAWVHEIITEIAGVHDPHCAHRESERDDVEQSSSGSTASNVSPPTTFLEPPSPDALSQHGTNRSLYKTSSRTPTMRSKRSSASMFSIRTGGHRRRGSDESSWAGKMSVDTSPSSPISPHPGDRWDFGSARVMQNLRGTKTRALPSAPWSSSVVSPLAP